MTPIAHRTTAAALAALAVALLLPAASAWTARASDDPLRDLQSEYVANKGEKAPRAYHFGSQGAGDVFSNHTSHTNRMVPVYAFGKAVDLAAVSGENSRYRTAEGVRALYGFVPEHTVNPEADYLDQADLYRVQKVAVARGAKYMFLVWFDGLDWPTTRAAAIAKTGKDYTEGKGSGLVFQDFDAGGTAQYGFCVTSPTHDKNRPDVDAQTVEIPSNSLRGGYDPRIAGPTPWTPGTLDAPGYLKGQGANDRDREGVEAVGGVLHAYTDSSTSAAEAVSGVKSYNNGVNVAPDGTFVPTLYHELQEEGWKVGVVTSVPFPHASPAAMYAQNVHRDDYQDIARAMLGLPGVVQEAGKAPLRPGLDVVMGTGFGVTLAESAVKKTQGRNGVAGNAAITEADKEAIRVENGGKYVVVETTQGVDGKEAVAEAAKEAAEGGHRLFGFFGNTGFTHLPFRTADGRFDPSPGRAGTFERYTEDDLKEQPTLADFTRAALAVLAAEQGKPFALFVEAGDVDFALHDNNLDNAVGAVYSGEDAIKAIIEWVEANSDWEESAMIVTSDHGHYLVIDDPKALLNTAR